jgi:aryl-alcohol dehydrogenase-like predicted oxidoreductase
MQYARLGHSGLIVSRLAFGSMTFGSAPNSPFSSVYKVDEATARSLVARAIDVGINFFNSADVYAGGESERLLGAAIGSKRKDVVIATKVGNRMGPSLIERASRGATSCRRAKAAWSVWAPTTSTSIWSTRWIR